MFVVYYYTLYVIGRFRGLFVSAGVNTVKNRRSKLELYLDVLNVIKGGTMKPTRIMYGANLSWKLVQGILSSLVTQGLIDETDLSTSRDKRTNRTYHITKKGVTTPLWQRPKSLIYIW